ncbi:hypothetical protein RHMOL_Rhmol10G0171700 [Rhododendron molle]|uniref:Uncharacterized protein n=1 Tax=Rhododendron molle TaxID=49168 RepID=A0ACC0M4Z3_RHOML|nr:hypothetical protein RHMOL_Rhmol10G0171700 [Rhododendron molle]
MYGDAPLQGGVYTEGRRAAGERQRGGEGHVRRSLSGLMKGGPPEMPWKILVVDIQGNPAKIHLVLARSEPASVTIPVPNEWVNEAIRRMLAMENVIRRAASGMPLELHYPAPTPPPAQRVAAQRPQEERDPKRMRVTTLEAAGEEGKKEEEEEGEEEEEHTSDNSGSDDSIDDPSYKKDPKEKDDDDDSDD